MATEPPKVSFDGNKDKREAVEIWLDQFNAWCVLQGWRDTSKPASEHSHWNTDRYAVEISALCLGMPPEVLRSVKSTVVPTVGTDPSWRCGGRQAVFRIPVGMAKFYSFTLFWPRHGLGGKDALLGHVQTSASQSVAEFEACCKYHVLRCEYRHLANPEEELIRDRNPRWQASCRASPTQEGWWKCVHSYRGR